MKASEKEQIESLRKEGLGYKKIAQLTGINLNTIKSFCRSNKLTSTDLLAFKCANCKSPLISTPKKKAKKFCCDKCRILWWNRNRNLLKSTAQIKKVCKHCGKEYPSYIRDNRKYCSHSCYILNRFKVVS